MKDKPLLDICQRLLAYRDRHGLTQAQMGKHLNYTQGHYSKVESGEWPVSRRFGARAREFLTLQEENASAAASSLEFEVARAMRSSKSFRALISAALKMHKGA